MNGKTIILNPKGSGRREVLLADLTIPDLWHLAMWISDAPAADDELALTEWRRRLNNPESAQNTVLEVWHLAADLLAALRGNK